MIINILFITGAYKKKWISILEWPQTLILLDHLWILLILYYCFNFIL